MRDRAGPLPAQPYILVLWPTHIGRYAIKHSPSENARASKRASKQANERASEPSRAIVKVLGTLCERSPPLLPHPPYWNTALSRLRSSSLSPSPSIFLFLSLSLCLESRSLSVLSLSLSLPLSAWEEVGPLCGCVEPRPGSARRGRTSDPRMWMDGWRGGGEREMARCVGKKKRERVCERDGRAMSKQSFASTPDSSSFFPLPHRRKGRWKEDGEGGEARLWELRCLLLSVERNVVRDSVDRDRAIDISSKMEIRV